MTVVKVQGFVTIGVESVQGRPLTAEDLQALMAEVDNWIEDDVTTEVCNVRGSLDGKVTALSVKIIQNQPEQ